MSLSLSNIRELFVGLDREVPLLDGSYRQYVNLDNAATTPPFRDVVNTINKFIDWYASVHRGTGYKSLLSTNVYNQCREIVAKFVGADPSYHTVIFCSNTTDAINRLCHCLHLEEDEFVLISMMEHHSNMLPWRICGNVDYIQTKLPDGSLDIEHLKTKLGEHKNKVKLVAITGASNITGYLPPIKEIAQIVHQSGAMLLVDAAQLIAHRPIKMGCPDDSDHIDFLAFSAHKMYAPFGSGALIGPTEFFEKRNPGYVGGGAVELVTLDEIVWTDVPEKEEAGSPNLIGVLALAKSIQILQDIGMENVAIHERNLTAKILQLLNDIPEIKIFGENDPTLKHDRVGVIPILLNKMEHSLLAAILGYEWGIGVRHGCFCAHPYIENLFQLNDEDLNQYAKRIQEGDRSNLPGFVRISLGLYNTTEEIEYLIYALKEIIKFGHKGKYTLNKYTGEYFPENFPDNMDSNFFI